MVRKELVLHLHDLFWPHNAGSTHRLANIIENSAYGHIVLSKSEGENSKVFKYRGILIVKYNSLVNLACLFCYLLYRYRGSIKVIHSHNYRASLVGLLLPITFLYERVLELHSIYEPNTIYGRVLAKLIYRSHTKLILLSESSKDYISTLGKQIVTIYNPIERKSDMTQLTKDDCKYYVEGSKFVSDATIVYVYFGSFDEFQGIHNIVSFAQFILRNDPGARLLIAGGGSEHKDTFENQKNVLHFQDVPKKSIPHLYDLADYSLLLRDSNTMTESAISLKILESLVYGVSVISTKLKSSSEVAKLGCSEHIHFVEVPNFVAMRKSGRFDVKPEFINLFTKTNASQILDEFYES